MWNFSNNPMGWFSLGFAGFLWFCFGFWLFGALLLLLNGLPVRMKRRSQEESALDILKARYAKGEIDKKEFTEKKKDLI